MRLRTPPESRKIRLRSKITAVLLSLIALWGFAAWVTVGDGWNLLQTADRDQTAGRPTKTLINVLQEERRIALVHLGARKRGGTAQGLAEQRSRTDRAIAEWRRSAHQASGDKIERAVQLTGQRLQSLNAARAAVDTGGTDRLTAGQPYNEIIDAAFAINSSTAELDDQTISADGRALIALTRSRELLAREDAFLASVISEGRFGPGEFVAFGQAVGLTRYVQQDAYSQLSSGDQARYERLAQSSTFTGLRSLEDRLLQQARANGRPGVTAVQWQAATRPALTRLDELIDTGGDEVVKRATPIGYGVLARLVLVAGLGLMAVVTSIVLAFTTSRTLLRQLTRLKVAATELAEQRLPDVVARLSAGEKVDVATAAPPLKFGDDEIGRVGRAINQVQETAIAAAVGQAKQRHGAREALRHQALRTQALVVRLHQILDRLERRRDLAENPEVFSEILRVDEVTTRIRRHTDNSILLSGGPSHRGSRRPVKVIDVIRSAMGQVEGYERVKLQGIDPRWLSGRAIDVTALLAELIENALNFSDPSTTVDISTQATTHGLAIEIQDKGLGLSAEQLEAANQMLAEPPPFDAVRSAQQGHLVAGLTARRHGITVKLQRSAYGGVLAVALLPNALFEQEPPEPRDRTDAPEPVGVTPGGQQSSNLALLPTATDPRPSLRKVPTEALDPFLEESLPVREPASPPPAAPAPAEVPRQAEPVEETSGGLPVRRPQASLAPELRTDAPLSQEEPEPDAGRSPEDVKRIMGAYQLGTKRGRTDSQSLDTDAPPADGPETPDADR